MSNEGPRSPPEKFSQPKASGAKVSTAEEETFNLKTRTLVILVTEPLTRGLTPVLSLSSLPGSRSGRPGLLPAVVGSTRAARKVNCEERNGLRSGGGARTRSGEHTAGSWITTLKNKARKRNFRNLNLVVRPPGAGKPCERLAQFRGSASRSMLWSIHPACVHWALVLLLTQDPPLDPALGLGGADAMRAAEQNNKVMGGAGSGEHRRRRLSSALREKLCSSWKGSVIVVW